MRRWALVAAAGAGVALAGVGVALVLGRGGPVDRPEATTAGVGSTSRAPAPSPRPVGRGRHPRTHPRSSAIPILMYHVVADPPPGAPYPELYVPRDAFAGQMAWLAEHGYRAVTLRAVRDHWQLGRPLPARAIVLTFDDGYRSQFTHALPVIRRRGWVGVLDLEVRNMRRPWGLSPRQVRLFVTNGWEVAAHTLTHPDLTRVNDEQLKREVAGSRSALRRMLRVPVEFFCYPAGRLDDRVVAAVKSAGYLGATTTTYGLARPADMFRLARVRVNRSDGVDGLARKLQGLQRPASSRIARNPR